MKNAQSLKEESGAAVVGVPSIIDPATGSGKQLSFLEEPDFMPLTPPKGSRAETALHDLCNGTLTRIDWYEAGKGFELPAAIKELDYLGWQPQAVMLKSSKWRSPIAHYSLHQKALQAAYKLRNQKGAGHVPE
jgi:hypothetical protein